MYRNTVDLKYIFIFLSCLFSQVYCFSQDSTYVAKFSQDFSTRVSLYNKFTALDDEYARNKSDVYKPNNPVGIGLGLSWKGTSLSFGYGFDFMRDKKKGKTHSTDFQYHYYGRKVIFDVFYQRYKGFYREDRIDKKKKGHDDDYLITLFPDIKIRQYGVFGQYVFNGKKFSSQAAFSQSEKQLKSVGSFLLGGGIYYNKLESDSSFVLNDDKKIKNFQIGVNGGYAYTWVIKKRYFVSGSLSMGLNLTAKSFDRFGKDKLHVYPTIFPRLAAGYNHDTWSIGASVLNNRVYVLYSDQSKLSFDTGAVQITFIKRFDTLPILSKLLDGR